MAVLVSNLDEERPLPANIARVAEKAAAAVLAMENCDPAAEVSIVFVDDEYIQRLNREYRGVDAPTDVLSFALNEGEPMPEDEGEQLLGDVVISLPTAERQAVEYGHSLEREVAFLTVHGVLHLLGYDHQTEEERRLMREKEEAVLRSLGLARD